jgi:uncharacterized protein (TIGR03435 family)
MLVGAVGISLVASVPLRGQSTPRLRCGPTDAPRSVIVELSKDKRIACASFPDDAYRSVNVPVASHLINAYGRIDSPILRAPLWFHLDGYDIVAPTRQGEDARQALQRVLAERFKLAMHYETRPIYDLVPARDDGQPGPNITAWPGECLVGVNFRHRLSGSDTVTLNRFDPQQIPCGEQTGTGAYAANGVLLEQLAEALTQELNVVVRNTISRKERFALLLRWQSDVNTESAGLPPLSQALQEQLGLKLRATENVADVIVVDSIERPVRDR